MSIEETIPAAGGLVAIVGLPAYIGWVDRAFGAFVVYALVAGLALAFADRLTITHLKGESAKALAQHAVLRILTVALVGGAFYCLLIIAV